MRLIDKLMRWAAQRQLEGAVGGSWRLERDTYGIGLYGTGALRLDETDELKEDGSCG